MLYPSWQGRAGLFDDRNEQLLSDLIKRYPNVLSLEMVGGKVVATWASWVTQRTWGWPGRGDRLDGRPAAERPLPRTVKRRQPSFAQLLYLFFRKIAGVRA